METDDLIAAWGQRLRDARGHMSQAHLAESVGTSGATISRIEAGLQRPSDRLRIELARVLNMSPNELFALPEEVTR